MTSSPASPTHRSDAGAGVGGCCDEAKQTEIKKTCQKKKTRGGQTAAGQNDEGCWESARMEAAAFKTISWLDRVRKSVMSACGAGGEEGEGGV